MDRSDQRCQPSRAVSVFINVIIGIGIFTGLIVVSLSMYMAVLQRTREIGILKSLGATKAFVMGLILWEAALMGFGGTIVGIALSYVSKAVLKKFVPASLPQAIVLQLVADRSRHRARLRTPRRSLSRHDRRLAGSHRGPGV